MFFRKTTFTQHRWLQFWVFTLVFGLFLDAIPMAQNAKAEIASVPLFASVEVAPNLVFIIDDSGSMQFETLPSAVTNDGPANKRVYYMFPPVSDVYGGSDYWPSYNTVPWFGANDDISAFYRSSHNNLSYYNPEVRYLPWSNPDGTFWPDADPNRAYHNPAKTYKGYRDLNSNNNQYACWNGYYCNNIWFYPATYFEYDGSGDVEDYHNYSRIEIKEANEPFKGGVNRTDCADTENCTYEEEIQNFANWYTYHRSRLLAARGGIGRAFAQQGEYIRVGYGTINGSGRTLDGVYSPGTMVMGVRNFSGNDREDFFDHLYGDSVGANGTPLRRGLDDVGQYYCRADDKGPWDSTPGTDDADDGCLACRNSYTILMTDGYWSEGSSYEARSFTRRANVDDHNGPEIDNPVFGGEDYQYTPEHPFRDGYSNTLADVAMYYWNRDLVTTIANKVPVSLFDEAYWQHMVTFTVGLVDSGSLDPATDLPGLEAGTTNWQNPTSDDRYKVDDLWHASLNSRGDFFSATNPVEFSDKLMSLLTALVQRKNGTAAAIATNSTSLVDTTLIYQAKYDSSDWSGELIAYKINSDGSVGDVEWTAEDNGSIPAYGSRKIYTWDGIAGVQFIWANLTATQKSALYSAADGETEETGQDRLNWLRGDQSKEEGQTGGYLRTRSRILGDIVNSDPFVAGATDFGYEDLPSGVDGQSSYAEFLTYKGSLSKMVYIGSNDGMLHAFDAATGLEKFAYVPGEIFDKLTDLTDPDYTHQYYVDGSPYVGDAYINGGWKSVLVGTLGAGGRSIFAVNVSDPDNCAVLWEFTDEDLGYAIGQPVVARMQNGKWVAIFGNGYESDNYKAFLFVVDLETGVLIRKIDTEAGSSTSLNGLATPTLIKDSQKTVKYVYAGDLLGNLWKFDMTDTDSGQWDAAFISMDPVTFAETKRPLFKAQSSTGTVQPITAPVVIGEHSQYGYMIFFGTGKYFETGDDEDLSEQSFYGIWDKADGSYITTTDRSALLEQTIIAEGLLHSESSDPLRVVSSNAADWTTDLGWFIDLVSPVNSYEGERVVSAPLIRHGRIVFTTLIPSDDPCSAGGSSWLMEMDALSGARLESSALDINGDEVIDDNDKVTITIDGEEVTVTVSAIDSGVGIIKTPAVIADDPVEYKYSGGSEGGIAVVREKGNEGDDEDPDPGTSTGGRCSWRQIK